MAYEPNPSPTVSWTLFGMLGSFFSGLVGFLSQIPAGTYIAAAGVAGSILVPIVRLKFNRDLALLAAEVDRLRSDRGAAVARAAELARQRDEVARERDVLIELLRADRLPIVGDAATDSPTD